MRGLAFELVFLVILPVTQVAILGHNICSVFSILFLCCLRYIAEKIKLNLWVIRKSVRLLAIADLTLRDPYPSCNNAYFLTRHPHNEEQCRITALIWDTNRRQPSPPMARQPQSSVIRSKLFVCLCTNRLPMMLFVII